MSDDVIERGYSQRASCVLLLLAKAVQARDDLLATKALQRASDMIDSMPASGQKEDVSAIYCAVMFALGNGFYDRVGELNS